MEKIFQDTIVKLDYVENGKIGLDKFEEKNEYDLILLDLQMPIMDGFQLATKLRIDKKSDILILALTANNSEREKSKCLDIGINGYLTKPFKQKNLFESIINVFSQSKNKYNFSLTKETNQFLKNKDSNKMKNKVMFHSANKNAKIINRNQFENCENLDPNSVFHKSSFRNKQNTEVSLNYLNENLKDSVILMNEKNINCEENKEEKKKGLLKPKTLRNFEEDFVFKDACDNNEIFSYFLKKKYTKPSENTKYKCNNNYEKNNDKRKNKYSHYGLWFNEGSIINRNVQKFLNLQVNRCNHIRCNPLHFNRHYKNKILMTFNTLKEKTNDENLRFNGKFDQKLNTESLFEKIDFKNPFSNLFKHKIISAGWYSDGILSKNNLNKNKQSHQFDLNLSKKSRIDFLNKDLKNNPLEDVRENILIRDTHTYCSSMFNNKNNKFKLIKRKKSPNRIYKSKATEKEDLKTERIRKKHIIQILKRNSLFKNNKRKNKSIKLSQSNPSVLIKDSKYSKTNTYINTNNPNPQRECELVLIDFEKENLSDFSTEEALKNVSINFDMLSEISGGDNLIEKDLISIFLEEFPHKIKALKEAFNTYELKTIQTIAHALKSNVAIFGIECLRIKFLQLEQAIKDVIKENKTLQKFKCKMNFFDDIILILKKKLKEKYINS